jgi:hypothetical protein
MIFYIQQTDTTYDSIDFDDPKSTITYFSKLMQSSLGISEEMAGRTMNYRRMQGDLVKISWGESALYHEIDSREDPWCFSRIISG